MSRLPKQITDCMQTWDVSADEVWPVPGGKAYAVKHSALERIAAKQGIVFGPPQIIEAKGDAKVFSLWGCAMLGDRSEWSTGEATPANNKNAYPLAMAEKRLKDRLTLKFLALHGVLYSEEEADDFKKPRETERVDTVEPRGLDHRPGKIKPPHWDAVIEIVNGATDYSDLTYRTSQPFYKNTTSGWSNFYLRKLADEAYLPKVAEFRGAEVAAEMQHRIHAKFPLDTYTNREAAE